MASRGVGGLTRGELPQEVIEVPTDRDYENGEFQSIDEALVGALEAAEAAEHEHLVHLLKCEIASLYYQDMLGV